MRLTNQVKKDILESWTKAKWSKKIEATQNDLKQGMLDIFKKEYEFEIKVHNENEEIHKYLNIHSSFEIYCQLLDTVDSLIKPSRGIISCPKHAASSSYSLLMISSDQSDAVKLIKKCNDKMKKYRKERDTLNSMLLSVTTVKKLIDRLPEIEKYVPKSLTVTALVSTNTLLKCKAIL